MALTHHVTQITEKQFMIEWRGIVKLIDFTEYDFVPKGIIWRAFQRGIEAERDRIYAITGEWPPKKNDQTT